jgi:tRNA-specific 2-thiouridylase
VKNKKKVLVGLSGGLDSTISALLLQEQGYEVIGVHFQLWHDDKAEKTEKTLPENKCCSMRDLMLARTVAKQLNIPFFVFDFRQRFFREVVEKFLQDFSKGLTPNPCVECNRSIKFGYFLEKMQELGCDFVATGHYVQKIFNPEKKRYEVLAGKDKYKDQTYFLYTLTQKKLAHTLFPMAEFTKDEVREIARKKGFASFAEKRESQGVCFYAEGSHLPFLHRHIPQAFISGDILDIATKHEKVPQVLGEHAGVLNFTKGQRARLSGLANPKYVVDIDVSTNEVWVGGNDDLFSDTAEIITISRVFDTTEELEAEKILVKIRHGGDFLPAKFTYKTPEKNSGTIFFTEKIRSITPGQSAVIYSKEGALLGGGILI